MSWLPPCEWSASMYWFRMSERAMSWRSAAKRSGTDRVEEGAVRGGLKCICDAGAEGCEIRAMHVCDHDSSAPARTDIELKRLGTGWQNTIPRRSFNKYEADRLIASWEDGFGKEVEPLHQWLGWTRQELFVYRKFNKLPK